MDHIEMRRFKSSRWSHWSLSFLLLFMADVLLIPFIVVASPMDPNTTFSSLQYSTIVSPILGGTEIEITTSEAFFEGYNLFELVRSNHTTDTILLNQSMLLLTMDGYPIFEIPGLYSPVEMINSTTMLCTGVSGATLYNIESGAIDHLGFSGHHEFEPNHSNNTIFTLQRVELIFDDIPYYFDIIVEYSMNGTLVWSLDTQRFISRYQRCPIQALTGGSDITHGNTIFYEPDEDVIYYCARNQNTFYKIDHKTGEVIWGLGEWGDFAMYNMEGEPKNNLFYHAHAVEPFDDHSYILFDNDFHNQTDLDGRNSRILEITIDETTMTANTSWSWTAPPEYYSSYWGDADRLPNGNRLGTFGTDWKDDENLGAILVEVDELGNIVWEMRFPTTEKGFYGVYRMERIRLAPILSSPSDSHVVYGSDVDVHWQAWYNFRPKRTISAPYMIYLNGNAVHSGTVKYDKFWRPTTISYTHTTASSGSSNLTLIIYDDSGHSTSDTVIIHASDSSETGSLILVALFLSCVLALTYLDSRN
ncbi:MAG: aryl-sulfate sulfotransferase [Candidatus Thorarchaeota archaeon]